MGKKASLAIMAIIEAIGFGAPIAFDQIPPWVGFAIMGGGILIGVFLFWSDIRDFAGSEVVIRKKRKQRVLSNKQRRALSSALIDREVELDKVKVIFSVHGGDEARQYANQLAAVLKDQGWTGDTYTPLDDDHRLTGLKIWYQPENGKDPNAARLAQALEDADIDFDWTPHDPPYSDANLFVYRKP